MVTQAKKLTGCVPFQQRRKFAKATCAISCSPKQQAPDWEIFGVDNFKDPLGRAVALKMVGKDCLRHY